MGGGQAPDREGTSGGGSINKIERFCTCAEKLLLWHPRVPDDHFLFYLEKLQCGFDRRDLDQEQFVNPLLTEELLS